MTSGRLLVINFSAGEITVASYLPDGAAIKEKLSMAAFQWLGSKNDDNFGVVFGIVIRGSPLNISMLKEFG